MFKRRGLFVAGLLASAALGFAVSAQAQESWTVKPAWVSAHENFLASPALRGRGSATPDETVAATYVASMFELYGLTPAPGMTGFLQAAPLRVTRPLAQARLTVGDIVLDQANGLSVLSYSGQSMGGPLVIASREQSAEPGAVVLADPPEDAPGAIGMVGGLASRGNLVIARETPALKRIADRNAQRSRFALASRPANPAYDMLLAPSDVFDGLLASVGQRAAFEPGPVRTEETVTTNAIGYLAGSDPSAGYILISAHLDHLGVRDGVIYPGANDDASGTTAVMEIAHALAAGAQPRRGVLFAAFGSEEIGGFGSTYFSEHPPVPLDQIVANIAIEMIAGGQDPKLPDGVMMMTGYERSNLGSEMKARGALIGADAYPEQNFFQRSDNYALALKGIVAHTISAYPTPDTYHQPTDDLAHVDLPFMTRAIQSLIEPVRSLASGDFVPTWNEGGRPQPR